MLLTEFDPARNAVIDPDIMFKKIPGFPETVVSVFSHQLFDAVRSFLGGEVIAETHDVDGIWPVYEVTYKEKRFAFYKARLGAPACVGCFEDVIPMGVSGSSCWETAVFWIKISKTVALSSPRKLSGMRAPVTIMLPPLTTLK